MRLAPLLLLALMAPCASAVDILPSEAHLGETEARLLVRSREGAVRVDATPPVLAAASAPGGEPDGFAPTPRALEAQGAWHGLEGVVVVVLRRASATQAVEVVVEDGSQTGVWVEWPGAKRGVAAPPAAGLALLLIATAKGFAPSRLSRR